MKSAKLVTYTLITFLLLLHETQSLECTEPEEYRGCSDSCSERCPNELITCVSRSCISGCFCSEGYKRNPQRICVTEAECNVDISNKCGQNEEWKDGNDCFQNCYNDASVGCTRNLGLIGCHCKTGYLRHPKTEACIPASECPLTGDTIVYPDTTEKSAPERFLTKVKETLHL